MATIIITVVFVLIAFGILVVVNWRNPGLTGELPASTLYSLMSVVKMVFYSHWQRRKPKKINGSSFEVFSDTPLFYFNYVFYNIVNIALFHIPLKTNSALYLTYFLIL